MGRTPCCDKANVKKGPWSPEEDAKLKDYIEKHGTGGNWISLPQKAGLKRCGKSCRLRWLNYLRPDIKHGDFSDKEDRIICNLFATIGSRWSVIAAQLPGRTDNDIKNYWNTKLKKKLMGIIPHSQKNPHPSQSHSSFLQPSSTSSSSSSPSSYSDSNHTNYPQPSWSFSTFEPISFSANLLNGSTFSTNAAPIHQLTQESFASRPVIQNYHVKDSLLVFGGEASCSSSDGSCSNHIGRGGDTEYGGRGGGAASKQIGGQNYSYHGVEETKEIIYTDCCSVNGWNERQDGMWTETPLDYGLEEIKQLISTSSCSNIFFDEN